MPKASIDVTVKGRKRFRFRRPTPRRIGKTCSSLLVPITICVFTIVTTVIQMNSGIQQREQDLQIAKDNREKDLQIAKVNREKDFEIANQTRILQNEIEENRRLADIQAQENDQMNTVLAAYLKDMSELMLLKNFTLSDPIIATVVRAKTLTTLAQLDGKRKAYIVRFLYEAEMMHSEPPAIDLTDADLSHVDLRDYILIDTSFPKCNLSGALFDRSLLDNINFYRANLTQASFISTRFWEVNFNADGNFTVFNEADMRNSDFTTSIFMNASFVKARILRTDMRRATFYKSNFTDVMIFLANFVISNLSESIFDRSVISATYFYNSRLQGSTWLGALVRSADFSKADLSNSSVTNEQMRLNWKNIDTIFPDGIKGADENLLKNGDAEDENHQCTEDPWHVNSMIATTYSDTMGDVLGKCSFKVPLNATEARMWQRIRIPNQYAEWISMGVANISVIALCECKYVILNVREFVDNSNISLANHTHNSNIFGDGDPLLWPMHTATTEIELEIACGSEYGGSEDLESGWCDNIKLSIWHRNYTL